MSIMKRELELRSDSLEDPLLLLNSAMRALHLSEINRQDLMTIIQLCEYLKTDTVEKLESLQDWPMTSTPVSSMKLNPNHNSIQQQTSELKRPNPPTPEAIKASQFKDKTYVWKGK